jgi:hypothetical protein
VGRDGVDRMSLGADRKPLVTQGLPRAAGGLARVVPFSRNLCGLCASLPSLTLAVI